MSSDSQEGKGGASIIPSARKSIHSYCNNNMVRYGVNTHKNKLNRANSPASDDQGTDEVDNVMSKMTRQASPLPIKNKKIVRTNSYSQEEEDTDDYSSVLSKSLPSTLPSRLYYSDDNDLEEPNYSAASLSKSRFEDSSNSLQLNRSNQSSSQHSPYPRRVSVPPSPRAKTQPGSNKILFFIIALVVGIIAALSIDYQSLLQAQLFSKSDKSTQTVNYDKILFENNMNNLQEKYNIDSNSILKLKSGISTIFSRMDTGSFMFVYNGETNNFNPSLFEKFINEVAYTAARYLRNNISSIKHTVVLSSNLDMQEHGELISKYRDDVDKSGVLLVKEIDSVPSELAMAFHYYCDEYDPLVKRSAIFFTLNLANCSNSREKKSTHDFIEKCLAGKWKTVPPENMRPLLTRVVDIIIDVTNVF